MAEEVHEFRFEGVPASVYENAFHIKAILNSGACKKSYTYEQLFSNINGYLMQPFLEREERRALVEKLFPPNRGVAGKELGKLILDLTSSKSK